MKFAPIAKVARTAGKIILIAMVFSQLCFLTSTRAQPKSARPAVVRSLPELKSRAEFDGLSRINTDAGYPLPHVMYVIDRQRRA